MKLWKVFLKSMREMIRDPLVLSLTLVFAPIMVVVYALFFPSGSTTYTILVLNQDAGTRLSNGSSLYAGEDILDALNAMTYADGKPLLKARLVERADEAG